MPAILQPTPAELRKALEDFGWRVVREDSYNWLLAKAGFLPLAIPRRVQTVPYDILYHCLTVSGIGLGPIHRDVDALDIS